MSSAYFGISSSLRWAAPRSSVIDSMPRCAASRTVPPGVSYMPRDFMPTKRFSTRSSRPMPCARLRLFAHARSGRGAGRTRLRRRRLRARPDRRARSRRRRRRVRPAPLPDRACANRRSRAHGIGRLDLVENRFVGMKSRGMYETPGGTILLAAHRGIESITLDRGAAHLKEELMPKYAELIYNGLWFTPEREMLQAAIDRSQEFVTGTVRLKLDKGHVAVVGRSSPYSLYDRELVTFEEGNVAYDHRDAEGFIRLNALRLRTLAQRRKKKLKPKK